MVLFPPFIYLFIYLFIQVESHASAVSLLESGEQRYIKAIIIIIIIILGALSEIVNNKEWGIG